MSLPAMASRWAASCEADTAALSPRRAERAPSIVERCWSDMTRLTGFRRAYRVHKSCGLLFDVSAGTSTPEQMTTASLARPRRPCMAYQSTTYCSFHVDRRQANRSCDATAPRRCDVPFRAPCAPPPLRRELCRAPSASLPVMFMWAAPTASGKGWPEQSYEPVLGRVTFANRRPTSRSCKHRWHMLSKGHTQV